ncbi:MAG TPA: hypothetical protein VH681_09135 [Nitrospiraceae bacterium]|jgi:hypothetical protein
MKSPGIVGMALCSVCHTKLGRLSEALGKASREQERQKHIPKKRCIGKLRVNR